jgi:hypothetical protein
MLAQHGPAVRDTCGAVLPWLPGKLNRRLKVNAATHTRTIKVHMVELTDVDIERLLLEPDTLNDFLNGLLMAPAPNGTGHEDGASPAKRKNSAVGSRKRPDRVACESCSASIPAYKQGKHKCRPLFPVE